MILVPIIIIIAYLAVLVNELQVKLGGKEWPRPKRRRRKDEY